MAAPAPLYDLILMLDPAAPDEQRQQVLANVEKAVSAAGEIVGQHDWGTRTMAYEIRHKAESEYHLLQFHGPATLLADLQRTLRITDGVVRFRIVKLAAGTPAPVDPPRGDAPVEAAPPAEARTEAPSAA
jgi:small subunit ribosomal protein S6